MATMAEMDAINLAPFITTQGDHRNRPNTRFVQMLRNHVMPGDQEELHPSDLAVFNAAHADLEFHNYEGRDGPGWLAVKHASQDGKNYVKAHNFGPRTDKEHDWKEIVPEVVE